MIARLLRTRPKPAEPAPPRAMRLEVAGRAVTLSVVENARARRMTLRIGAGGRRIGVTVPPGTDPRAVERFVARHHGWLEERLARLPDRPQVRPGVKIPLRGVPHLVVHEPERRGAAVAETRDGVAVLAVGGDRRHLPRRIADLLKRAAKADIERLVAGHAATVGRRVRAIRYRDTSSRWGSCTADGTLSFSWRIMMAPPVVIDYLVAHEVAHLKEMNHGPRFWALCRTLCPRTDEAKAWLKRNGDALQAIAFD